MYGADPTVSARVGPAGGGVVMDEYTPGGESSATGEGAMRVVKCVLARLGSSTDNARGQ